MSLTQKLIIGGVTLSMGLGIGLLLLEANQVSPESSVTAAEEMTHDPQYAPAITNIEGENRLSLSTTKKPDINTKAKNDELMALIANYNGPKINVDVNGNLIVDNALKLYLEHLTHWIGVEGVNKEDVYRLSLEHLQQLYSGDLLAQITDQFNRFWHYNNDLNSLMSQGDIAAAKSEFDGNYNREDTIELLSQYQGQRNSLRNEYFNSDEEEAFFGDENRYDAFYKQSLIDGHTRNAEQLLSQSQREYRKKSHVLVDLKTLERETGTTPGSQEWKQEVREKYDSQMAERIILAQDKKLRWQDKKNQYFVRKDSLLNQASLSEQDLAVELDRIMRDELAFSDTEVRRIQALEGRFQQKI